MRVDECILEVDKRILSVKYTVYYAELLLLLRYVTLLYTGARSIVSVSKLLFLYIKQCTRCRIEIFSKASGKVLGVVEAYLVSDFRNVHAFVLPVFQ